MTNSETEPIPPEPDKIGSVSPAGPEISAGPASTPHLDLIRTDPPADDKRPAGGASVPVPVMLPRAFYPFGWTRDNLRRALWGALTTLALLIFLWLIGSALTPFLIAFFLAALLDPILRHQERNGRLIRTRVQAILLLYLFTLAVVIVVVILIVPPAARQITDISLHLGSYLSNIHDTVDSYMKSHMRLLRTLGIRQHNFNQLIADKSGPVQEAISKFLDGARNLVQAALGRLVWFVVIPIAGFFFMRDFPVLRARLIGLCPERHQARVDQLSREIVDVFSAYLRGLGKICALMAFCAFILFQTLNLNYALFLGLVAGLFYAVPYIGNFITAGSAVTIAFLMDPHPVLFFWQAPAHSVLYALVVGGSFMLMASGLFDNILYPRIVGGAVGLYPVVSIFALVAGASLFGVWGLLLATPVAASLQIVLTYLFPRLTDPPPAHLRHNRVPGTGA